jgi:MFS transporter, FSR family, fosmidomycin resistance protein
MLSSAFSTILVYPQELLPGKVGLISGFFFGFAFGMAGMDRPFSANWQITPASNTSIGFAHFYL